MRRAVLAISTSGLLSCGSAGATANRTPLSFASSADYGCPVYGNVATGDFDGDGHLDVAVGGEEGRACLLFNNGDGTFGSPVNLEVMSSNQTGAGAFLVAMDIDGDGRAELLMGSFYDVYLFHCRSDRTFVPPVQLHAGASSSNLFALGDFNDDGALDVAFEDGPRTGISDLGAKGVPTGKASAWYLGNLQLAFAADMNGDGRADLVGQGEGGVAVALTTASGVPASERVYSVPTEAVTALPPLPVDMNGDGVADVVSLLEPTEFAVLLTNPDGTLQSPVASTAQATNAGIESAVFGDLDGDGTPDAMLFTSSPEVLVFHGDRSGAFRAWNTNLTAANLATDLGPKTALADLDGDGKLDLIEADSQTTRIFLRR